MKQLIFMLLICLRFSVLHAQNNQYDIFSYKAPHGFTQMGSNGYLHYEKRKGKNYCQLFIYPAVTGQSDIENIFLKTGMPWPEMQHKMLVIRKQKNWIL
jgi:hypothetical protein